MLVRALQAKRNRVSIAPRGPYGPVQLIGATTMLREATSASNDGARLDDIETVPDDAYLGAELDGASAGVRVAAIQRSRGLPEAAAVSAAWRNLPASARDKIGEAALVHHFYALIHQIADRPLTLDAGTRAAEAADAASAAMDKLTAGSLPGLYGTKEAEPLWALQGALA